MHREFHKTLSAGIKVGGRDRDGLFRRKDGVKALEDPTVRLENGALEASNVNAAEEMINVIRLQRMFTTQVKLMKTAEEMDQQSNNLMRIS